MKNQKLNLKTIYCIGAAVLALLAIFFIFIPAFAGKLFINPIITIGNLQLRWYGLILAAAILCSYFILRKNSWKFGIAVENVDDYSFWAVIIGVLGARIYYVLFSYSYFSTHLSEIYKIWHGGLSIYGAIIAGGIFTYLYARNKAYNFWHLFDLVALGLPLGQAIGRLGNFVNQEAFGMPTNLPWKMYVAPQFRPPQFAASQFFHPAFLYELLFDVLVFFVIYKLVGKTKSGVLGLTYLVLYSLGRFFIEAIRLDSFIYSGFRIDQVVAFLIIVAGGWLIFQRQK